MPKTGADAIIFLLPGKAGAKRILIALSATMDYAKITACPANHPVQAGDLLVTTIRQQNDTQGIIDCCRYTPLASSWADVVPTRPKYPSGLNPGRAGSW